MAVRIIVRSVRPAGCSTRTSCVPAWVKSSDSLRILVLEKCLREKSIMGSNTEARTSVWSSGHDVRTKRAKREKLRSSSDSSRPKWLLARLSVLAC
ncbi:hypothetical protein IGI04_026484 [Brassica rapa subsp. trilocularis]|uniref:Uncharacterized protein n=1 Tax=Brassica rapa subsp. trilocularis TaxID=1813537 RepID=A0ABQ7KXG9_BRACM|nr:hypothetical protein IGI04_026484 [Brassica rapa subsp. trilocularis]